MTQKYSLFQIEKIEEVENIGQFNEYYYSNVTKKCFIYLDTFYSLAEA